MFTAYDVHKTDITQDEERRKYPFGIGAERAAAELRKFADLIVTGAVVLQRVTTKSSVKSDDFPMSYLEIEFYEPRKLT